MKNKEDKFEQDRFFYERFDKEHPIVMEINQKIVENIYGALRKIGDLYEHQREGYFRINQKGELEGSPSFFLLIGMMSKTIIELTTKQILDNEQFVTFKKDIENNTEKIATKVVEQIAVKKILKGEISAIVCDNCGTGNESDAVHCKKCGEKLGIDDD
jgi:ribosomal protein L40E